MSREPEELRENPTEIWRKTIPGGENSTCKGPQAGRTMAACGNTVGGQQWWEGGQQEPVAGAQKGDGGGLGPDDGGGGGEMV